MLIPLACDVNGLLESIFPILQYLTRVEQAFAFGCEKGQKAKESSLAGVISAVEALLPNSVDGSPEIQLGH